jgi:hypothetical protein
MSRKAEVLLLALLAALLGYTLLEGAGGDSNEWLLPGVVLAVIAVFALGHTDMFSFQRFWPLLVLPVCIAIQLLTWPARSVAGFLDDHAIVALGRLPRVLHGDAI